jgi:hypothetical protein
LIAEIKSYCQRYQCSNKASKKVKEQLWIRIDKRGG